MRRGFYCAKRQYWQNSGSTHHRRTCPDGMHRRLLTQSRTFVLAGLAIEK